MSEVLANIYKNEHMEAGERAWQVKCLLYKHEEQHLDLQHPGKCQAVIAACL